MSSFADYSTGKTDWWRYPITIVLALFAALVVGVILLFGLMLMGLDAANLAQQMQHATQPAPFFAATGVTFAILLAGFAGAIALVHRQRPADILGRWRWSGFLAGAAIWLAATAALSLVDLAIASHGFTVSATRDTPSLFLWATLGLAVQTFAEEYVFRGYLTQGLLRAIRRPWPAAIISGPIFGSVHIPNGLPQAANATVLGIVLAMIAIRTGGLAFGYGLHLANNLFGAVVLVSGGDVFKGSPGLFTQNTPGLMWFDTVSNGLAIAVVGALVLYRAWPAKASIPG
jgi:membrane protease YdiL (CAAX protease family)